MLLLRETIRKKQHKITKRMKLHAFLRAESSTYFRIFPNIYLIKIKFFPIDNKLESLHLLISGKICV